MMDSRVAPTATPKSRGFALSGTPRQQESWTRRIERDLMKKARDLRREAAKAEKIAAKIEAERLASRPITRGLILEAVNCKVGYWAPCALAGIEYGTATRQAIIDALWPRRAAAPTPSTPTEAAAPTTPRDPLAEAVAIVRSAAGEDVSTFGRDHLMPLPDEARAAAAEAFDRAERLRLRLDAAALRRIADDLRRQAGEPHWQCDDEDAA
jgi:hypothetical protein